MDAVAIFCPFGGGCRMGGDSRGNLPRKAAASTGAGTIWKRPEEEYPLEEIPAFAALDTDAPVDATTWEDLEMDRVFRRVNGCQSAVESKSCIGSSTGWSPCRSGKGFCPIYRQTLRSGKNCGFCWPGWGNGAAIMGCRISFSAPWKCLCPWGHSTAVCPAAFGRDFAAPLEPVGRRQRHSLRFGVELGALLSGKSRIQGDLEHLRSFSALLWVAEELGKTCSFPPVQQKIEASVPGFPRLEGPAGGAGPPRFFGIGAIAGIFPHPHPAGFAPVPQGDGVYPGPPPRAAPSL